MGYIVFTTDDLERDVAFYRDVLEFVVSDHMTAPFSACFFHLNARRHSFALVGGETCGVHHLMVETLSLDNVGHAYDIADQEKIGVTLGRHTNDYMTSFCIHSPLGSSSSAAGADAPSIPRAGRPSS